MQADASRLSLAWQRYSALESHVGSLRTQATVYTLLILIFTMLAVLAALPWAERPFAWFGLQNLQNQVNGTVGMETACPRCVSSCATFPHTS